MKRLVVVLCLCLVTAAAFARSPQEVKSEIKTKRAAIEQARVQKQDVSEMKRELNALSRELRAMETREDAGRLDDGGETCDTATEIASVPYTESGYFEEETGDDYDIGECGCDGGEVVYSLTIGEDGLPGGIYTISTCGSWFDTVIHLWYGCPSNEDAVEIGCNDDAYFEDEFGGEYYACGEDYEYSSCVTVSITVPGTYYIVFDGYCGDWGEYVLNVSAGEDCHPVGTVECSGEVDNAVCEGAAVLSFNESSALAFGCSFYGSFPEELQYTCEGENIEACGLWYYVMGTGNLMTASTCHEETDYDTKIHVFSGNCGELSCVVANDDGPYGYEDDEYWTFCPSNDLASYVEWCSEAGVGYYIFVSGYDGETGCFGLEVRDSRPCTGCNPQDYYFSLEEVPFCQCLTICPGQIQKIFVGPATADQRPVATWSEGCLGDRTVPPAGCDSDCDPAYPQLYMEWIYLPDRELWCMDLYSEFGGCYCFCIDRVLPVELNSFSATAGDSRVTVAWSTASESGLDRFEIIRDGAMLAQLSAQNAATGAAYSWTDESAVNGTAYEYALVLVNLDGSRETLASETAVPQAGAGVVTGFALHQNYPNPFNPSTSISFSLPEIADVDLRVINALGQEVATLAKGAMDAGMHTVTFDGTNLPSGLYFYTLRAGNFSAQQKMVLLK